MENDSFNHTEGNSIEGDSQISDAGEGATERERERGLARAATKGYTPESSEGNWEVEESSGENESIQEVSHRGALEAVRGRLGEVRGQEIEKALIGIDRIGDEETLSALEQKGKLTPEDIVLRDTLTARGISAANLTPEDARGLYEWTSDASEEIKNQKAEVIADTVERALNGKRRRRDQGRYATLQEMNEKFTLWERGEIDTSKPFDDSPYVTRQEERFGASRYDDGYSYAGYDEEYEKGYAYSTYSDGYEDRRYNELMIEDYNEGLIDEEELDELVGIDPEDMYVYGPYTHRDLRELAPLARKLYVSPIDWRARTPVGRLLSTSLPSRPSTIEEGLDHYFVMEQIAPNRRLDAKDMVSLTASLCLDAQELLKSKEQVDGASEATKELRKGLGWCSYYLARVCRIALDRFDKEGFEKKAQELDIPDEEIERVEPLAEAQREEMRGRTQNHQLKHRYDDRARPISEEFYQEALARAEGWTDREAEEIDESYNSYLIKLDDWLDKTEKLYRDLGREDGSGDTEAVIPDTISMIGAEDQPRLPSAEQE